MPAYNTQHSIDAFGRLRVSEPFTVFDSKQIYDKAPLVFDESTTGSPTSAHVAGDSCVRMTTQSGSASSVIRQSFMRFNYQPGKSQLIFCTFANLERWRRNQECRLLRRRQRYLSKLNQWGSECSKTLKLFSGERRYCRGSIRLEYRQNEWERPKWRSY